MPNSDISTIVKRNKYIHRVVNLDGGPITETLPATFFNAEYNAHMFIIELRQEGKALSNYSYDDSSVTGLFLNANDQTVPINNNSGTYCQYIRDSENDLTAIAVVLPNGCYAVEGRFTLTLSLRGAVIYECQSYIKRRSSNEGYDPEAVIHNLNELYAEINNMASATVAANAAAAAAENVDADLEYGTNSVTITVTGRDGTTKTQTINVTTNDASTDLIYDERLLNNGQYVVTATDMEGGAWSWSSKVNNTKRLRNRNLIPVSAGMQIAYTTPTLRLGFWVLASKTATGSFAQNIGFQAAGSSGVIDITANGYLIILVDSTNDITVNDYDCDITIFAKGQIAETIKVIDNQYVPNLLSGYSFHGQKKMNGITCKSNDDGSFDITGTASASAVTFFNVFYNRTAFPAGVNAGGSYIVASKSNSFRAQIIWYSGADDNGTVLYNEIGENHQLINIPDTATGITVRWMLAATSGATYNDNDNRILIMPNDAFTNNLGEFLNNQFSSTQRIANAIEHNVMRNYLGYIGNNDITQNGITCSQNNDGTYNIAGTAESDAAASYFDIIYSKTSFPFGIVPGNTYHVYSNSSLYSLAIIYYTSKSDGGTMLLRKSGFISEDIAIPQNATGLTVRWIKYTITQGETYSDLGIRVTIMPDIAFFTKMVSSVGALNVNQNIKIWCIGNSFMNGAVWKDMVYNHMVEYDDAIYGQVAYSLNISPENNNHVMYSSTGLVSRPSSPSSNGSFLDIITSTDIKPYDYLMTQFNGTDIANNLIGTVDATANDGTLAGAVVRLVNYLKTVSANSTGRCKLILLSVPPYSQDPAKSGQNVFTGQWRTNSNNSSINDLDNVMYALAKKYHFIYISWQDLEMSYHYMDFADRFENPSNPDDERYKSARHAKDDAVYRALGEYVALQIRAVSSPIAIGKLI